MPENRIADDFLRSELPKGPPLLFSSTVKQIPVSSSSSLRIFSLTSSPVFLRSWIASEIVQ